MWAVPGGLAWALAGLVLLWRGSCRGAANLGAGPQPPRQMGATALISTIFGCCSTFSPGFSTTYRC